MGYPLELQEKADAAKLAGAPEVLIAERDDWRRLRMVAQYLTTEPCETRGGRHWFRFDGVRFCFRFRPATPDDDYVECLEVAGMI